MPNSWQTFLLSSSKVAGDSSGSCSPQKRMLHGCGQGTEAGTWSYNRDRSMAQQPEGSKKTRQPLFPHHYRLKAENKSRALCSAGAALYRESEREISGIALLAFFRVEGMWLDRGLDANTHSQMQPLTGSLPCDKGHLQSIPLERKLWFGHCEWLRVRPSPKPLF